MDVLQESNNVTRSHPMFYSHFYSTKNAKKIIRDSFWRLCSNSIQRTYGVFFWKLETNAKLQLSVALKNSFHSTADEYEQIFSVDLCAFSVFSRIVRIVRCEDCMWVQWKWSQQNSTFFHSHSTHPLPLSLRVVVWVTVRYFRNLIYVFILCCFPACYCRYFKSFTNSKMYESMDTSVRSPNRTVWAHSVYS